MPDMSDMFPFHSGQVEKFLVTYKCIKLIQFCILYFIFEFPCCIENTVDPEASRNMLFEEFFF